MGAIFTGKQADRSASSIGRQPGFTLNLLFRLPVREAGHLA
jgi:hypothetical protein